MKINLNLASNNYQF